MSLDNALQAAVYDALVATGYAVYDHVPPNTDYPFITIDYTMALDASALNDRIERHSIYLTFWSDYPGQKEIKDMQAAAHAALHRTRLTLTEGSLCDLQVTSRETRRDVDEITYMGSMTVAAILTP